MQPDGKKKYIYIYLHLTNKTAAPRLLLQYVVPKNGDFAASRQEFSIDLSLK